jgi:hypothetical protein
MICFHLTTNSCVLICMPAGQWKRWLGRCERWRAVLPRARHQGTMERRWHRSMPLAA